MLRACAKPRQQEVRTARLLSMLRSSSPGAPTSTSRAFCHRAVFSPNRGKVVVSRIGSRRPMLVQACVRTFAILTEEQLRRKMEEFNDLFIQARDELEFASESKETTYFNEEAEQAKEAVDEALQYFEGILAEAGEAQRKEIMSSSGLRVEQLKAELEELLKSDDH